MSLFYTNVQELRSGDVNVWSRGYRRTTEKHGSEHEELSNPLHH